MYFLLFTTSSRRRAREFCNADLLKLEEVGSVNDSMTFEAVHGRIAVPTRRLPKTSGAVWDELGTHGICKAAERW
jgi:hypothetical protein